jgi:Fur family transcriptional regulator, peroxide stress response regulator
MANANDRFDKIIKKLKRHNHHLTPQRLAIIKVVVDSDTHPNVEEIHSQLRVAYPTMSLATVYRNVMLLKSLGEVLELGFPDGSNRYDGKKPFPHPHVICVQCKKILDPDLATAKDMAREVATTTGFKILTHRMDFFGICQECGRTR